jgi:putative FmdB family regulatory protein
MPLYEYQCRACAHQFELLVRPGTVLACPACNAADLERCLSLFGVATASTRQTSLGKARVNMQKANRDQAAAERERMENHHH